MRTLRPGGGSPEVVVSGVGSGPPGGLRRIPASWTSEDSFRQVSSNSEALPVHAGVFRASLGSEWMRAWFMGWGGCRTSAAGPGQSSCPGNHRPRVIMVKERWMHPGFSDRVASALPGGGRLSGQFSEHPRLGTVNQGDWGYLGPPSGFPAARSQRSQVPM